MNHPYLVIYSATAAKSSEGLNANSNVGITDDLRLENPVCGLCRDPAESPVVASCGHYFCRACAIEFLEAGISGASCTCPICDKPLSINLVDMEVGNKNPTARNRRFNSKRFGPARGTSGILQRIGKLDTFRSSTKIEALREEIDAMIAEDPSSKAIVFSQFTSMLDLVGFRLEQTGIKTVRLHGRYFL